MNKSDRHLQWPLRILFLILLLPAWDAMAAEFSVSLDRNRITEGETVTLILQTSDPQQNLDADFKVLENDFEILDRRSETQMSIVNGAQSAVVRLLLTLEPRHSGHITIPAMRIGSAVSKAVSLRVDPAPEPEPGALPPVFIEVEVEPDDTPHYVHAQLALLVRVFYQQSLTEAAISPPEPAPASVRLLDEVPYQAEKNGERYRVLERHYAIFPERSGELTIPALQLTGRLVERRSDRLWQPTVRGRRISVESEPIVLNIQPRPAGFTGNDWQPARGLSLTQQVSATDALRVGEPVTRTVIVDAVGLEENMITEPRWPELADARIYPDQPQGISRDDGRWVLGHKEFRYAVVPETEGELLLPELTVSWWDTISDRERSATLPAQLVKVQASALAPPPATTTLSSATLPADQAPSFNTEAAGPPGIWRWTTLLFAVLWLATMVTALKIRRWPRPPANNKPSDIENESRVLADLKRSCAENDVTLTRSLLGAWLGRFGPGAASGSLLEFASGVEKDTLKAALYRLDATGFKPGVDEDWNGKEFWAEFRSWLDARQSKGDQQTASVTDLYAPENRVVNG
jgi:hypothetical protein